MNDKLTRNKTLIIICTVMIITLFNIITATAEITVTEEEFEEYNAAGVVFQASTGLRFNYSHLGGGGLNYNEGYFYRVLYEENETHLNFISITWSRDENITIDELLNRSYNYTDTDETFYMLGETLNSTIHEHSFLNIDFNKTGPNGNRTGYLGWWNCTNSDRVHTLLVENRVGVVGNLFQVFNETRGSVRCHYPGQRPPGAGSIRLPFDVDTLINVGLMIMFTIGFSFTYMMEGFPNFAHTTYAGVGALSSFYLTRFFDFNPYDTWPFAALFGGIIGVMLYQGIVKPIKRNRGYQDITLTLTFLMVATVLPNLFLIFNYWARYWGDMPARGYNLRWYDFSYNGVPGIAIMSTATCVLLIIGLRYFLTKSKVGLSLRAVAEDANLAASIGINTDRAHNVSWFISGALASIVGSIMTLHRGVGLGGPDGMIINVMSGAILGGIYNVYGAIIGGVFVVLAQSFLKKLAFRFIGFSADKWQNLFPIIFLVIALMVFPNGITGEGGISRERFERFWGDLKEKVKGDSAS